MSGILLSEELTDVESNDESIDHFLHSRRRYKKISMNK